jgi:hypothetical protein
MIHVIERFLVLERFLGTLEKNAYSEAERDSTCL